MLRESAKSEKRSNACLARKSVGISPFSVPADHKRAEWDLVDERLKQTLRGLCAGQLPWPLLLFGEPGSGKSCAGLCLVRSYNGWYSTVGDFCRTYLRVERREIETGSSMSYVTYSPTDFWNDWRNSSVTILDEFGLRSPTEFQFETLQKAIDLREGLPFVAISNHDPDQLAAIYDDRYVSRLACGTQYRLDGDRR